MRSLLVLALGATLLGACAPRMTKTHFDRWADESARRKLAEEEDEKVEKWLRAQAGVGAQPAEKAQAAQPPVKAEAPVATSTATRVIRPGQPTTPDVPEEESIY